MDMTGMSKGGAAVRMAPGATRRGFLFASSAAGMAVAAAASVTTMLRSTAAWARSLVPPGPPLRAPLTPDPLTFGSKLVIVREGTNMSAAVSPNGRFIVFDVLGVIWTIPASGGTAKQLTSYLMDAARPHWSPDGEAIAFQGYRDGNFNIWIVKPDGGALRQLTTGPYDNREPRFSPDSKKIAFTSDRAGRYATHILDIASGEVTLVPGLDVDEAEPAWSPDGAAIAVTTAKGIVVRGLDGALKQAPVAGRAVAPSWSPDGAHFVHHVTSSGKPALRIGDTSLTGADEDVFPFPVAWTSNKEFLYTADGQIKRFNLATKRIKVVPFKAKFMVKPPTDYVRRVRDETPGVERDVMGVCEPALSPSGDKVAFCALNQLWLLTVGDPSPKPLTDDASLKYMPAWSPDGASLVYSCDRAGTVDLWLRVMKTGEERRLTHTLDAALSPAWSPDGSRIAFVDRSGVVSVVTVANGAVRKVIEGLYKPGRPSWSKDGATLALAVHKKFSDRFREGMNVIGTIDVAGGTIAYRPVLPDDLTMNLDGRIRNGPAWSPDGSKIAFAMAGFLWVQAVDAKGVALSPPVQLTDETSETPSWSGDSTKILYQSNGALRMISATGGEPETVPFKLSWSVPTPSAERTVIHAGKLWDGRGDGVLENMDVVIEAGRIIAVEPHRERTGVTWINASGQTVMPGLIDMHSHSVAISEYGAREGVAFLAFGVTTIRSLGTEAYRHAHASEATRSGLIPFPRYYGAGETVDGTRVYYPHNRPMRNKRALEAELLRAKIFDYDSLKCYARLPLEFHKRAIEYAHELQIPSTSHYMFPAVAFGGDGKEHLYGTDRFGYNRGISIRGKSYQDVVEVQAQSGAARTPTLFGLTEMPAHPELLTDPRINEILPVWDQRTIAAAVNDTLNDRFAGRAAVMVNQIATLKAMMEAGALVVGGTDTPHYPQGISLHHNFWYMVRFGFKPVDALRTATSISGDYLGQGQGAVEPGKFADLIVVDGNPLERIEDAMKIKLTIVNGKVWSQEDLLALVKGKAGSATTSPEYSADGGAHDDRH